MAFDRRQRVVVAKIKGGSGHGDLTERRIQVPVTTDNGLGADNGWCRKVRNLAPYCFQAKASLCRNEFRAEMTRADGHAVGHDGRSVFHGYVPLPVAGPEPADGGTELGRYQRVVSQCFAQVSRLEPATAGKPETACLRRNAGKFAGLIPVHRP